MANISVKDATKDALDLIKVHDREPYDEVITRLLKEHNEKRSL